MHNRASLTFGRKILFFFDFLIYCPAFTPFCQKVTILAPLILRRLRQCWRETGRKKERKTQKLRENPQLTWVFFNLWMCHLSRVTHLEKTRRQHEDSKREGSRTVYTQNFMDFMFYRETTWGVLYTFPILESNNYQIS